LTFSRTQEPAIDSRILVIARRHQPVFNRTTFELLFGVALPHANTKLKLLSCYLTPNSPLQIRRWATVPAKDD
jgi:hypothetical protein